MKRLIPRLALPCLLAPVSLLADDFTGFSMDFVEIGDAGNANDNTGYGGVDYGYRISKYEVSGAMIDSYNANSGGPAITRYGPFSASQPAVEVSWNEAARFVNWLNTSSGYSAAYKFETGGGNDNIVLWGALDSGYDAANPFRNTNAYYFLPSEDEWYKSAYYDPNANGATGGYWNYATGSDTAPAVVTGGTTSGTAVYNQISGGPAEIMNAGGLSPYGTMAQSGNVFEWGESGFTAPNDSAVEERVWRGGSWGSPSDDLASSDRSSAIPTLESFGIGFRVASVPEPSETLMKVLDITTEPGSVSGTKVTLTFTADGMVDVYASDDLATWGAPVASGVTDAAPLVIDNLPGSRRFFVLVTAGETYPAP